MTRIFPDVVSRSYDRTMESPWPHQRLPTNRKRAVDELVRGRELAYSLQLALRRPLGDSTCHEDLVAKILGSFSETLSILESIEPDEISQLPNMNSHSWDAWKSEDSSESCKPSATSKDKRGCYKRRKTSETWCKETSTLIDDGHAWRKYGQKVILHAVHPRNYFRCTHKFDQGCLATKQVQMIQDNPTLYRITYHGRHTCKNLLKAPQIILDTARDSSVLLRFDQSANPNNIENRHNDSLVTVFPLTKQETKEEVQSLFQNQTSSSDNYFLSSELTGPMSSALSAGSDHGDVISSGVYSCTASTHSLGMDMVTGSMDDFDDVLQFEF